MAGATSKVRKPHQKKRREALSCTECARRKLKCSKTIPCTACKDRDNADFCHRREEIGSSQADVPAPVSRHRGVYNEHNLNVPSPSRRSSVWQTTGDNEAREVRANVSATQLTLNEGAEGNGESIDTIAADAPVTLEFLALSRSRMLRLGKDLHRTSGLTDTPALSSADAVLTIEQVRSLMSYHQHYLTWIHNVIHLPTFRRECESFILSGEIPELCWLALYYAMLSVTFYHISREVLATIGSFEQDDLASMTYQLGLQALEHADYTANHQTSAVQAICLLIYVGHNIGQSDRICVLLASATRIAQCLAMHRLGEDSPRHLQGQDETTRRDLLVEREVRKRTWWFLVRQDWLQIPYANTYTIHPSQFNTPMPANCFDETDKMIMNDAIHIQPKDVYTHGSFTAALNKVSVLIWQTQDRMLTVGHPNGSRESLNRLYEVVLRADHELKDIIKDLPSFLSVDDHRANLPSCVRQQTQVLQLTLAHKFYSIHRHFQVLSFKNPWFSYTRISCVSISLRSLRNVFALPHDEATNVARNMWTVNTQIITAAIWIVFELLYAKEGETRTNSDAELQDIVRSAINFLRFVRSRSRIARNGIRLLDILLDASQRASGRESPTFDIYAIVAEIRREAAAGTAADCGATECSPIRWEKWIPSGNIEGDAHDPNGIDSMFDLFADETLLHAWDR